MVLLSISDSIDHAFTVFFAWLPQTRTIKATVGYRTQKFVRRFRGMEALAESAGKDFAELPIGEQLDLWARVKADERAAR